MSIIQGIECILPAILEMLDQEFVGGFLKN
jgi:hypothetical protein